MPKQPSKIHLHKQSKQVEVVFGDTCYILPAEYLRTHSPSAEVRGHGIGNAVLVYGKIHVGINNISAVGNYGLRIAFDDNHDSGIFSWDYLAELGQHQKQYWEQYLATLNQQHKSRDPHTSAVQLMPAPKS